MSLEEVVAENTAALRELTAALRAGATPPAGKSRATHTPKTAPNDAAQPEAGCSAAGGETRQVSNDSIAGPYAKLRDAGPTLESVRHAISAVHKTIGREQAEAVLARFGAKAVTARAGARGLDEAQYPAFLEVCIGMLAGHENMTAHQVSE